MRLAAQLKLSYFPLPIQEAWRIKRFLRLPQDTDFSVLDPCAGCGTALREMTSHGRARRYGIELDAYRAEEARRVLDEVIQGDCFDVHAQVESLSCLYINPPFQHEIGEGRNRRMEELFLAHTYRWLKPGGVLVFVSPITRLYDCRGVLNVHFKDKAVYRLTEPDAVKYNEAVVFGVRRSRGERERLDDAGIAHANRRLFEMTRQPDAIPPLPDDPDQEYPVPPSGPVRLEYRGLPLDAIEDLLERSLAWRRVMRVTHAPKAEFGGRPLLPLHQGHVAILLTSGRLNSGVFGNGPDRHLAFWESAKTIEKFEETRDDGVTEIRERERFSQRLTLLYADGRTALLSERKEAGSEELASTDGSADIHATDP